MRKTTSVRSALTAIATSLLLLDLSACASVPKRGSGGIALRVPDSIGVFALIKRHDYPDAALGVQLRYQRADSLWADVFLYPGADLGKKCNLECARKVLEREGAGFIASFPEYIRRGYMDTIAVTSDRNLKPSSDDQWRLGRHLRFDQRSRGQPRWSDLYLYYLPGYRIKVRATYAPDSLFAGYIAAFATAAVPALTERKAATVSGAQNLASVREYRPPLVPSRVP